MYCPQECFWGSCEFVKWCCVNCTMANPGDMLHCYESGILRHGCFTSPFFKENCGASSTAVDCGLGKAADKLLNACSPHHVFRQIMNSFSIVAGCPSWKWNSGDIRAKQICKLAQLDGCLLMEHKIHTIPIGYASVTKVDFFMQESGILRHGCFTSPFFKENCGASSTAVDCGLGKAADKLLNACSPHHVFRQIMNSFSIVAGCPSWKWNSGDIRAKQICKLAQLDGCLLMEHKIQHEGGNFHPGTGAADEVGTNGGEGYCVNVPWSCGGVGDNFYIYAFQHVVIRIAGFDAGRGDSLGCCDVTPAGYSRMNEFPIATTPSRAGLQTIIDVMNIQIKKSGEKEASSGPYIVKMESKEAFVQLFLLRADIIGFYTNGVTCELKSLLEPRQESNQQHYGHDIASKSEGTETGKVLPCALSHSKKNASPKVLSFQVAYAEFQDNYASLSLLPTKYALWNLFHQVLSNTEDIQSSAVDLLTYTSQAGLFESHTRFTVLNDVDETGNEPMSSLSLTKGGEQGWICALSVIESRELDPKSKLTTHEGSIKSRIRYMNADTLNLNDDDYLSVEDMMAENEDEQNAQVDSITSAA
ncbi:hypothetical protein DY000_02042482 [Brassica cretica]|uniref:histone deacetylase n=1 Tax=Brassica cretica TaxID=69181 RepID=A0ABQ7B788_BRACR|nr:hypothetical protein DY000_02042482 [Brassica cretica]